MESKTGKKTALFCVLFAGTSVSVYGQPYCSFNGWNVGGGLGLIDIRPSISTSFTQDGLTARGRGHADNLGAKGNLFIGYSVTPTRWLYLGSELGLNVTNRREVTVNTNASDNSTINGHDTVADATGFVKLNTSINTSTTVRREIIEPTLDFKPGLLLTPDTVLYARLGMSINNINVKSKSSYHAAGQQSVSSPPADFFMATSASTSQQFGQSKDREVVGWRTGFGLISMIRPRLGLSADYIFTFYNHGNLNRTSSGRQVTCDMIEGCSVTPDGFYSASSRTNVSDHEVLLQLVYYLQ